MRNNISGITKTAIVFFFVRTVFLSFLISILLAFYAKGQSLTDPRISVTVTNMPLGEVLKILELKTNFTFSYLNEELPLQERVTLDVNNEPLQQILEILSTKCALGFTKINNIITVKRKQGADGKNAPHRVGTLRGIVRDSVTSEVLPYASIYIQEINTGASTDSRGFFIIPSVPIKKDYTIIISFVGYSSKKLSASIQENQITHIDVYLAESTVEMDSVLVTGERVNDVEVTVQKISIKDIENMTHGVETDVMRSIQLQPGVQSAGDVSARYYVRGGASNENLVLLNETPIYNPFHALGIFSVIDPDMINSVEFYKGGFGARYDGRLSSVINIITKDGNRNNFGVTAAVSQLTVKTVLEGPIPDGSFLLTGRKSYSSEVLKKFTNDKNVPIDFYDVSFKINYSNPEFIPLSKFTFFGFASKDKIDYQSKLHSNYNWSNSNVGFNWFTAIPNNPYFAEITLYNSKFSGGEIPNSSNNRHIENKVDDYTLKTDFNYIPSDRAEIYGGVKFNYLKTMLLLSNASGRLKNGGFENTAVSIYAGYKFSNSNNLKIDFGSRLNMVKIPERSTLLFEPRMNVVYSISPTLNIKGAWGIYQQELVTISDEDEVLALFEPWIVTPDYLKISSSIHYIGGIEYYLTENFRINMDGYYKVMHNLAVLNDEVIYSTDNQLIDASGESHGSELTVNYKDRRINAQLSYAYSWTTKTVRGFEYHPRYDSRNAVKLFINSDCGNNWSASIVWNYNSGMPYTQILGYYSKFNPLDIFNPTSPFTDYFYYPILAERNATLLPDYHRLDMSISKKIRWWSMNIIIDLNIINVYGRENFFYFDQKTGERVNMLPFFPSADMKIEL